MSDTTARETGSGPRSGASKLGREARQIRALRRQVVSLRAENVALRELCLENAGARHYAARLWNELSEIRGSLAWKLVERARRVAAMLGGQETLRGRGLVAAKRLVKTAARRLRGHRIVHAAEPSQSEPACATVRPRTSSARPIGARVSVIVPSYNHAPFLEERLRSIFAQTYPPLEILFLDDASSDDSVAIAERLAAESPVPFRILVNSTNSGVTFRQWLRGIDLAAGDLIWIAESDDSCEPGLLERLVPEFDDPSVMLAYCQSAAIGPDGRRRFENYLFAAEDLGPAHWRHPFRVSGREEVERALGQRNTIPNASAVVFRRPADIDESERRDLETLRLGGDWLFYVMRIRRGKIAFAPETLNYHRHHDRTVRTVFDRSIELFNEQLAVKERIFTAFPRLTPSAISGSLARSIEEYGHRTAHLPDRLPMTRHPRLAERVEGLRRILGERLRPREDTRILLVLSGVHDAPATRAMIDLARALAKRFAVFVCNALPGRLDPTLASRLGRTVVLLEGSLGLLPWSWDGNPCHPPDARSATDAKRAEIIRELIAFHRIDVIHSRGWWADRLVAAAGPPPEVAWFIDLRDGGDYCAEARDNPAAAAAADSIVGAIRGALIERRDDLQAFPRPESIRADRIIEVAPTAGTDSSPSGRRDAPSLAGMYQTAARAPSRPGTGDLAA